MNVIEWQLNQAVTASAVDDAWELLKTVVPEGTAYRLSPDLMKLLGTLVVAHQDNPRRLSSALMLALEAAYRLGQQSVTLGVL